MGARPYTNEQNEWLIQHAGTMPYKDLTELFNKEFGTNKKDRAIAKYCHKHLHVIVGANTFTKIKNMDYLIELYKNNINLAMKEIAQIFNEKFGTNYSTDGLESALRRRGIRKTDLGHIRGNTHNESPLLSVRLNSNGMEMIKVRQGTKDKHYQDGWVTLASYKWEQYHGQKLAKNEFVLFVNNDKRDYRPENLVKVTKGEYLYLCQNHMIGQGECLLASLDIIRAKNLIKELKEL